MARIPLLPLFALVVSACVSAPGPVGTPEFEAVFRDTIPLDGSTIEFHEHAAWFAGADEWPINAGAGTEPFVRGALVITNDRLAFASWDADAERYELALEIPYSEAVDVRRRVYMNMHRLVVETRGGETQAFQVVTGANTSGINKALRILRGHLPSSDAPGS